MLDFVKLQLQLLALTFSCVDFLIQLVYFVVEVVKPNLLIVVLLQNLIDGIDAGLEEQLIEAGLVLDQLLLWVFLFEYLGVTVVLLQYRLLLSWLGQVWSRVVHRRFLVRDEGTFLSLWGWRFEEPLVFLLIFVLLFVRQLLDQEELVL